MPETISIPKNLAVSILHVLAQLPAGQVAKMLVALDSIISEQDKPLQVNATDEIDGCHVRVESKNQTGGTIAAVVNVDR